MGRPSKVNIQPLQHSYGLLIRPVVLVLRLRTEKVRFPR